MLHDLRYTIRTLRQNPGFAATAIISIALAIGANASIFSLAEAILLRPLPAPDASRVVSIRSIAPSASTSALVNTNLSLSYPDYIDFRDRSKSFEGLIAYELKGVALAKDEHDQAQFKMGYLVSGNLFRVLGIEPALGRAFRPEEDQAPGRDAVVVLSYDFWSTELAADPAVVGRRVRLNGDDFTVIGVAPKAFTGLDQFIRRPAFFAPMMMARQLDPGEDLLTNRGLRKLGVKGRLKSGVTLGAANDEISTIARSLEESYAATNKGFGAGVRTELQLRLDQTPVYGAIMFSLFALMTIVLLIACGNVANLMLSRGRARAREIAVRAAIGAGRLRLIRHFMLESVLIALAGGVFGVFIASFANDYFARTESFSDVPVTLSYQIDHRVLVFTLLVSMASAVLFGLVPAIRSTKADLTPVLKSGARNENPKRFVGRSLLVAAQIAGAVVLLISAASVYKGARPMLESRGFRIDHLLTVRFDASVAGLDRDQSARFQSALLEKSRALAGVKSAAFSSAIPLTSILGQRTVIPEGYSFPAGQKSAAVMASTIDGDYFEALGVPLLRGRSFNPTDAADSPRVVIVNRAFADQYLGGEPIGRRIRLDNENGPWAEVVGVAATGKYVTLAEPPTNFVYLPLRQYPESRTTLFIESYGDAASLAAPVREMMQSINPNVPVLAVRTMDDIFQRSSVQGINLVMLLLGSAGVMGFALALAGLYAVISYQTAGRTREIGIRMALGAERPQVVWMVLRRAVVMGLAGVAAGVGLTAALRGVLSAGSPPSPVDPWTYTLVPLALFLTALIAAAAPALSASRTDPLAALREE